MTISLLHRFRSAAWHVAYRRLPEGSILEDVTTPFVKIPNQWPFCSVMDPFVFEYQGVTYIFAELYDSYRSRGILGYCRWMGGGFSAWAPAIIEDFHLSYPFIFSDNDGNVFLIPESFQSKTVRLYQAIHFPEKWKFIQILANGVEYVDSTFFQHNSDKYAFVYDISKNPKRLLLFRLSAGDFATSESRLISQDDANARPGGRVFRYHDEWIRVGQDCREDYGKRLVFRKIQNDFWINYKETEIGTFGPEILLKYSGLKGLGVHTYNATSLFEVIDVKNYRYSLMEILLKLKRGIARVFTHKH